MNCQRRNAPFAPCPPNTADQGNLLQSQSHLLKSMATSRSRSQGYRSSKMERATRYLRRAHQDTVTLFRRRCQSRHDIAPSSVEASSHREHQRRLVHLRTPLPRSTTKHVDSSRGAPIPEDLLAETRNEMSCQPSLAHDYHHRPPAVSTYQVHQGPVKAPLWTKCWQLAQMNRTSNAPWSIA